MERSLRMRSGGVYEGEEHAPDAFNSAVLLQSTVVDRQGEKRLSVLLAYGWCEMTQVPADSSPLSGITVVEFAGLGPITVAGMMLSDMGARVIRIDRRHHPADDASNLVRRNRASIVLNLKHPSAIAVAHELARASDILIEAYRPGVMERLQLGPVDLKKQNPSLIYGRLTGWGQTGPLASTAGHDITYLALTGALYPMGPADRPPTPPMNYVADMGAGAMLLVVGILAALQERQRSGLGQVVDAAMVDGVALLLSSVLRSIADGSWSDERGTNVLDGGAPFYTTYECADGEFIAVGAIEPQFYQSFVNLLGLDIESLPDQMDCTEWPRVTGIFQEAVRIRSRAEWEEIFRGSDACVAPVLRPGEAPLHPHIRERSAYFDHLGAWHPSPAPKLDRTPFVVSGPSPERGADTEDVLLELGWTSPQIEELRANGAVYCARRSGTLA